MGRAQDRKEKTHRQLLRVAARAIRRDGPFGIGAVDVMRRSGLTHGGFYAHFESRDDLVAAAITECFRQARSRIERIMRDLAPADGLAEYVDFYLSPAHRDTRTDGCPIPFLSADVPRLAREARARYSAGMDELVRILAERFSALGASEPRVAATCLLSELAGVTMVARAEPDRGRSNAILASARTAVLRRLEDGGFQ